MLIATAPGKLVLLGEYAVLRGAPALVAAVDRRARVTSEPRARGFLVRTLPLGLELELELTADGEVRPGSGDALAGEPATRLSVVRAILTEAARKGVERGIMLAPASLTIDSTAFYLGGQKLGLGSSAAVAVALWGAICAASGLPVADPADVFTATVNAHRTAQKGKGSGVDVAASTFGGVLRYIRDQVPTRVTLPPGIGLVAVWSGESASTPELITRIEQAVVSVPAAAAAMVELGACAVAGQRAVDAGNGTGFLDRVRAFHQGMEALGKAAGAPIVTQAHAAMARAVDGAGGAYKPAGAGGGDLGVAFYDSSKSSRSEIEAAIVATGHGLVPLTLSSHGLEITV